MRILLIGEYSGFHNALKKGLVEHGHEVTLVGDGDGFKQFPVDIKLAHKLLPRNSWRKKLQVGLWKLTGIDLKDRVFLSRFRENEQLLKNYDIVQFINSNPFHCEPAIEWKMLDYLLKNNKTFFLSACGDDAPYIKYLSTSHEGYSILKPEPGKTMPAAYINHTLKYLKPGYVANYNRLLGHCKNIIPSNTDYAAALSHEVKTTTLIAAPVQIDLLPLKQNSNLAVIHIFLGINQRNYWKKGINYFEDALTIIERKYASKVEVTRATNLPYATYINAYQNCHILLDQVLCYDQGYNALEAMAQGKVVFAGGSSVYLKAHGLKEIPVIDAQPDVDLLVNQLSMLIEKPETIIEIGVKARAHVLNYHHYKNVAGKYLELYNS
jgi:hypothetical protein